MNPIRHGSHTDTADEGRGMGTAARGAGGVVLHLHLIGQMEARTPAGENMLPLGRKTRALLAILALAAPRPVARARLAELLWSRRLEEQARASLRQEIHRLGEVLTPLGGEVIRVTRDHLALRPELVWIDVHQVLSATTAEPSSLDLLDGELLDEFDSIDPALDQWLARERDRLRDRSRGIVETLLAGQGAPEAIIPVAQKLLSIDRAHEGAWRALMRAHAERGERSLAIQAFDRCRLALADKLDAAPSAETQHLVAAIRAGSLPDSKQSRAVDVRDETGAPGRSGARVGVLPLQMVGTGEDEAQLSHMLAEEVTSALMRFGSMIVVSSSAMAQFASRDEAALRHAFDLDFLLDGSVQRAGRRLRVTMRLLDLREGNQIVWARRFDRQADDQLALQDEVAAEIVAQIDPEIMQAEGRRAAAHPAADASPYETVLRALPLIWRLRRDEFVQAGELLARTLELDPDYAAAHAWRAYWGTVCVGQGWSENHGGHDAVVAQAGHHAERAVMLDPQDARNLTIAGQVRAFLHHRPREAQELHAQALALNPNLAMAWGLSAVAHLYLGDFEEAARRFARYKRLSPMDPTSFFYDAKMGLLELCRKDYGAAVTLGRRASELNPRFSVGLQYYLSALGHAGRVGEAAAVRERLLAVQPGYTVQDALRGSSFEDSAQAEHYARGLRLAGLAESGSGT